MAILVTGFESIDDGLNASKILVESLRDDPPESLSGIREFIHYAVMPPSTHQLRSAILENISRFKPAYCVFTGQAPGRNKITFERLATNLKDFGSPDGDGNQPQGDFIETDGPAAYWSNLPNQEALVERLNENDIPAAMVRHTIYSTQHGARSIGFGSYRVSGHVAQHCIRKGRTKSGAPLNLNVRPHTSGTASGDRYAFQQNVSL